MKKTSLLVVMSGVAFLAGCADPYQPTMRPDYTIHVVSTPNGDKAIPPACPSYATQISDPYDNQPMPQFGCAYMRNLAMSVEQPSDLVHGRDLGPARGVAAVGAVRRYDNNQTRGLIDPNTNADSAVAATTSSAPASALSGDITGGASATSSSSSSSSPAASGP